MKIEKKNYDGGVSYKDIQIGECFFTVVGQNVYMKCDPRFGDGLHNDIDLATGTRWYTVEDCGCVYSIHAKVVVE